MSVTPHFIRVLSNSQGPPNVNHPWLVIPVKHWPKTPDNSPTQTLFPWQLFGKQPAKNNTEPRRTSSTENVGEKERERKEM